MTPFVAPRITVIKATKRRRTGLRKLILRCVFGLGDTVLFTAAIRDLHRCYPNKFITDVRTPCGDLWNYNPYLQHLDENDPDVEIISCKMPLMAWANQVPYHILLTFIDNLNEQLGLHIKCTEFKGEIYLSRKEKSAPSPVADLAGADIPFWIIVSGGKHDLTTKWWDCDRYQGVVDYFKGRVQFVQVGERGHFHPKLRGAIDLRGALKVRELAQLVYHSQGVLCGVTGVMHLAAAVGGKNGSSALRPCVVVAGGREPTHFEAYPNHQFIHTIGALSCCAKGGCWKMRAIPLGDGHPYDHPRHLCVDVNNNLPRCMDMISVAEVTRRIELYFERGAFRYLEADQAKARRRAVSATRTNVIDSDPVMLRNARYTADKFIRSIQPSPGRFSGRGILIPVQNSADFTNAWVCTRILRQLGCKLPIQLWHLGESELAAPMRRWLKPYQAKCISAKRMQNASIGGIKEADQLKPFMLLSSSFKEVLLLEPNTVPVVNPEYLFEDSPFIQAGAVFWPFAGNEKIRPQVWQFCGMEPREEPSFDTAQLLVDKEKCWKALVLCLWYNANATFFHPHTHGERETFHLAFRRLKMSFAMPARKWKDATRHYDFRGRLVFQHPTADERIQFGTVRRKSGFRHGIECNEHIQELRNLWKKRKGSATSRGEFGDIAPAETEKPAEGSSSENRGQSNPRFAVVTLHDKLMARVGKVTAPMVREYAATHSYKFICHTRPIDPMRHPAWNKIIALRNVLEQQDFTWAMWIDADAVVMNHTIPAETLIPKNVDAVFASDFNGLNSGIFMVRRCEWSLKFLETLLFLGDINHDPDGMGMKWEQNTIKHVLKNFSGFAEHVSLLPERWMNSSVNSFETGDFILHLGAMANGHRLRILEEAKGWIVR